MEIQRTNLKTRPEAPLNQNKNELEPESKVCFEIKTEQTLLETCERGTLHYRMHWPHNQQAGPILQSIEEWKKSLTPAKKCACVFISVLLGHSEPKYLAVDECALGSRSSEIVGLVMLQKWRQNMAVQKPVAAAVVAVPTPPPTHSRGGTLNGSKKGCRIDNFQPKRSG